MGQITHYITEQIMHKIDSFGCGMSNEKRCILYQERLSKFNNPGCICADGSAFDSTQHKEIQEGIDLYFYNKILNNHIDEVFGDINDIRTVINQTDFQVQSKNFGFHVNGTQMSGRMNTTLGNTVRSMLYIMFILHKAGIKQKSCFFQACGDDQIIFLENNKIDSYIKSARNNVYSEKDFDGEHGLGQVAKIFDVYKDITGAEFLSQY